MAQFCVPLVAGLMGLHGNYVPDEQADASGTTRT